MVGAHEFKLDAVLNAFVKSEPGEAQLVIRAPLYLFKSVEDFLVQMEHYVAEALTEGLAGWQVTDCRVTMTESGYASPVTSAADFRRLTQLVLR